jgi:hypothetical protein
MSIGAAEKGFSLQCRKVRATVPAEPQGGKALVDPAAGRYGRAMSNPLIVDLPHTLGAEEARRRIERNLGKLTDHIPGGARVGSRWSGNRLDLDIDAMGQQVAAEIDIQESLVRLKMTLPPSLAFFSGMLEPLIRKQGAAMLEDKRKS